MIVGFKGTEAGPTKAQLSRLYQVLGALSITKFVHGGSKGCDTFAHRVFENNPAVDIEIWPADNVGVTVWMPMGEAIIYDRLPVETRNRVMVRRIHGLIASPKFSKEDLSETWNLIREARKIGLPIYLITPQGKFVPDGS